MRGKTGISGTVIGLMLLGGSAPLAQARAGMQTSESSGRAIAARRAMSRCMLEHMLADRTLSYLAANSLCLGLRHPPRDDIADQTPGTIRKSRTAPSPKAASAA